MGKLQSSLTFKARSIDLLYGCIIAGVGLLLVLPAMTYGVFDAMDIPFHLRWTAQFAEQFWRGDLYPRWLHNMNAGLGSPVFFFYAPIPFFLTSLFHPLFANDPQNWGPLAFSIALAMIASGLTAYLWLKSIVDRKAALIGAILYMALPYHLGVNLYWRFAFAEYWALVWLPLILYGCHRLIQGSKPAIVALAISYAALIMTHLPSFVVFAGVPILYVLAIAKTRVTALIRFAVALGFGMGLAAIYWLPAMTTQDAISMRAILEAGYDYRNNFLFSTKAAQYHNQNFWTYLEIVSVLMIGVATCAFRFVLQQSEPLKRQACFWWMIAIVTFFMMIPLSQPVWSLLPPLQRIQFPWRLNAILLVATTALITVAVHTLTLKISQRQKAVFAIATVLTLSLLLSNGVVIKQRLKPHASLDLAVALKVYNEEALEYRPRWVPPEQFQVSSFIQLSQRLPQNWEISGQGEAQIQVWKPRYIALHIDVPIETELTLKQFYYSGWTARLQDFSRLLPVQPSAEGLLQVKVPSGSHNISVTLEAGMTERLGQMISTISLLGLLGGFWLITPKSKIQRSE
ncbi:MAG: YfhO family protein [Leptolyngbya sp. Prado105]|jgi:hypothetical protein|nr:YfhO family protein [Leptolyngbya sp. Prado105]